jgi:hypothetical protein
MAYECTRYCKCGVEYHGHDRDNSTCGACEKKAEEQAKKDLAEEKEKFISDMKTFKTPGEASNPNRCINKILGELFDLKKAFEKHCHYNNGDCYID